MNQKKEEKKAKTKTPTALKRVIQNEKRRLRNKSFKSKVKTAIRSFKESAVKKEEAAVEKLNSVFSLMDKGMHKKIFKKNKSSRIKSRLSNFLNTNKA